MIRTADLSEDGLYRYSLLRCWEAGKPGAVFIMLNPSTADAEKDDPTIRRCIGFAKGWGCGTIVVVNLFAWRATRPKHLREAGWPVGERNNEAIHDEVFMALANGGPIVAAWGTHLGNPRHPRVMQVVNIVGADNLGCLGTTANGSPKHPLYVPASAELVKWTVPDGD